MPYTSPRPRLLPAGLQGRGGGPAAGRRLRAAVLAAGRGRGRGSRHRPRPRGHRGDGDHGELRSSSTWPGAERTVPACPQRNRTSAAPPYYIDAGRGAGRCSLCARRCCCCWRTRTAAPPATSSAPGTAPRRCASWRARGRRGAASWGSSSSPKRCCAAAGEHGARAEHAQQQHPFIASAGINCTSFKKEPNASQAVAAHAVPPAAAPWRRRRRCWTCSTTRTPPPTCAPASWPACWRARRGWPWRAARSASPWAASRVRGGSALYRSVYTERCLLF